MRDKQAYPSNLTSLIGTPVTDPGGRLRGRIKDIAVGTGAEAGVVVGLILKTSEGRRLVPAREVHQTPSGAVQLKAAATLRTVSPDDPFLMLDRDLLDQQIIDVHGRKVVRVNDVDLQWFCPGDDASEQDLRVREVEVGLRGAIRRIFKGLMSRRALDAFARNFPARVIPWELVDLIEADPARRVKLKIEHTHLSQMHPSDLADILEDLAPAERKAIFTTLDEEVAAETLEEVEPKLQRSLIDSLDSATVAGIVEEMDPGAAADMLGDLPRAHSRAILEGMNPEDRHEVEELLEFREDSAAGRMTTDFVAVPYEGTVADAINALREFEGDPDTVSEVYLLNEGRGLRGVVSLSRLVLAQPETRVAVLTEPHFVSGRMNMRDPQVAELFDKYNLRALPVLDPAERLVGIIQADHVIGFLRERRG
ncbi:MAG TPA: CBS domain-containing protein [Acidisarcina sp.]